MSHKTIAVAAMAALGLSLAVSLASAAPLDAGAPHAPGAFALLAHNSGGGGGHGGGSGQRRIWRRLLRRRATYGGGATHSYSSGSMHYSAGSMHYRMHYGSAPSYSRRTNMYRGRRGHWRHGHWYGWGYNDQSCFAECRAEGYSPAYCYANSYEFCY